MVCKSVRTASYELLPDKSHYLRQVDSFSSFGGEFLYALAKYHVPVQHDYIAWKVFGRIAFTFCSLFNVEGE